MSGRKYTYFILFGPSFREAALLLPLLVCYSFTLAVSRLIYYALQAHAELSPIRTAQFAKLAILASLLALLLPSLGLIGAVWAMVISSGMATIIAAVGLARRLGWNVIALCAPTADDVHYFRAKLIAVRAAT